MYIRGCKFLRGLRSEFFEKPYVNITIPLLKLRVDVTQPGKR